VPFSGSGAASRHFFGIDGDYIGDPSKHNTFDPIENHLPENLPPDPQNTQSAQESALEAQNYNMTPTPDWINHIHQLLIPI